MLKHGNKLNLKGEYIVDKHSIGGVPGNRTTPIVVSICSAAGLIFPKTSSRAITSAAGTADVIETIARVDFSIPELKKIIKKSLSILSKGFITMVLKDLGYLEFEEPFKTFFAHGLIIKDGAKMSKSKGNVINPDKYIEEYGADTLRVYLMFMGPLSEGGDFRDAGMNGIYRFLQRIWGLQEKVTGDRRQVTVQDQRIMHKTIKKVTGDIEQLKFNTAIASLMEWLNHLSRKEKMSVEEYKILLLLLAPFAPHVTEELWEAIGEKYSIHKQSWPKTDNKYLEEKGEFLCMLSVKNTYTLLQ